MPNKQLVKKRPEHTARRSSGARRLTTALILLSCIVLLVVAAFFLDNLYRRRITSPNNADVSSDASFAISSVTVSGQKKYDEQEILSASGLRVGQSVWSVSEEQACDNVLAALPYVDSVTITSPSFGVYQIAVVETEAFGALYDKGEWVIVGKNGHALEREAVHSDTPPRRLYLKGATYVGEGLGKPAMGERDTTVCLTLSAALETYEIEGVTEIDLTDKSDLSLCWKDQITVRFGNDSRLEYQVSLLKELLPRILKNHGAQIQGVLDLTSYTSDSIADQAIFTPQALL